MSGIANDILRQLENNPGFSDKELTEVICGHGSRPQYVNQVCRSLEAQGLLIRRKRGDGHMGNWLEQKSPASDSVCDPDPELATADIPERIIKQILEKYLNSEGWRPETTWDTNSHGFDIRAERAEDRWFIRIKNPGPSPHTMMHNFHTIIGEIVHRMDHLNCNYSIALPDMVQFRKLWARLPESARSRLGITVLFVNRDGKVALET